MQNEDNQKYAPFDYHEFIQQSNHIEAPPAEDNNPEDNIVFTEYPDIKVICHSCRKEINNTTSILTSKTIYRCVGCFAKELPSDSSYQIIKSLNFPIIENSWKAKQEILFLTLLEKHGFNNWADIKEQMDYYGYNFSVAELQNHYYQNYLSNDDFLPRLLNNEDFFQKKQQHAKTHINPASFASLTTNHREEQQHEYYPGIENLEIEELLKPKKGNTKQNDNQRSCQFYNQKRREFDNQYDTNAELMLANLEFRDDDNQQEKRIKFHLIDLYNQRLEKRYQIKKFIIEHRLIDPQYLEQKHMLRNELEKQSFEQLKPVARFMKLNEFDDLVKKVAFTKQIKSTIQGLRKLRRTHPSNYKSLEEFVSSQQEQSKPKKKVHGQNGLRTGKRTEQLLQKKFNLNRKQFDNIVTKLATDKKTVYNNIQAVILERNTE